MKVRDVMSEPVIRIRPEESVSVASRTMTNYNIGALPVCESDGKLCGMVTDRDIVTRCLAAGKSPEATQVRDVMTQTVSVVRPDMDTTTAAALMSGKQIRRLPVMADGRLCGFVSLGDLATRGESRESAGSVLSQVSSQLSRRE